jgi:hypothetical protein
MELRLRRDARLIVGGREAEGKESRSRATNGPGNGPEVGIVGGREAEGKESRSRATNGPGNGPEVGIVSGREAERKRESLSGDELTPGNGPEVHTATDRETAEGARWKACQQWLVRSQATTGVDHRSLLEQAPEGNREADRRIFGSGGTMRG